MDNFKLDVVSAGREQFERAISIAMGHHGSATHYAVIDHKADVNEWVGGSGNRKTLVLFWTNDAGSPLKPVPFPCKMRGPALVEFLWHWLETIWEESPPGDEPDHDGSNSHGWRVFNEAWGHVASSHYAFLGVQPVWAMHGK